jgi:signal transduction histidine kinase
MKEQTPYLRITNLSKRFGAVDALSGVSFDLEPGEILGVVGQRGSGKTTLFKLLSGVYAPTTGEIIIEGQPTFFKSAAQAKKQGIETVYQDPILVETMSVWNNIFLGREFCRENTLKLWPLDGEMARVAGKLFEEFDLPFDLVMKLPNNLSNEQKQVTALARALSFNSRLLLLDDVLAPLNFQRQQILLSRIKQSSAQNVSVIISSDDLKHLFSVTDRILVLFEGKQIALKSTSETTPREIVELIVGSNRRDQITPVIWAFENFHAAQQQAEELRLSQQTLKKSLQEQDSLNQELFEKLRDQMVALDRLNLALRDANRRLMTEREAERKALARELHDQVIQDLLSFNYQLEDVESEMANELMRDEMKEIRIGIRQVISSLREVCSDLRPPTIDSHGLSAAIRSLTHQWSKQNNIEVELEIDNGLGRLPEPIELSVFRILQEGLRNVRKHANASKVQLSLARTPTASLVVRLKDNGQGLGKPINLAVLSEGKHFGLLGVSERVSLLGGTMQVESPDSGGLDLQIEIPSPYPAFSE